MEETNFQPREFSRSGSKAEEVKEREKERPEVGNNNSQLHIAMPPQVAHVKPPGPKSKSKSSSKPKMIPCKLIICHNLHPSTVYVPSNP